MPSPPRPSPESRRPQRPGADTSTQPGWQSPPPTRWRDPGPGVRVNEASQCCEHGRGTASTCAPLHAAGTAQCPPGKQLAKEDRFNGCQEGKRRPTQGSTSILDHRGWARRTGSHRCCRSRELPSTQLMLQPPRASLGCPHSWCSGLGPWELPTMSCSPLGCKAGAGML